MLEKFIEFICYLDQAELSFDPMFIRFMLLMGELNVSVAG
jgi:hypothetical protein